MSSTTRSRKPTPGSRIRTVASEKLGFESLRPGQEEAVTAILEGHDTLVVQPTGSGKSAIYQIAGLLIDGSTVIVSPLIALQKDQVDSLEEQKPAEALALNSTQRMTEIRERLARVEKGQVEYIFLAPEQLRKPETVVRLQQANVSLFVVDEAHCVSQWGHDFRPDYLRLGHVIEAVGHPRVLGLTATASPRVREEIVERLRMRKPKIFVQGFDRPNIHLRVDHFKTVEEKRDGMVHRVRWADKPGIVYVGTRKAAEEIMHALSDEGIESLFYHGGLKGREREVIQERFMSGDAEVIVATNAFGMGVDKPDVRFVYHFDPPESLDSYYQEIGRAGRDGEKSEAVLFYRRQDIGAQSFKTGEGKVEEGVLREVAERIGGTRGPIRLEELARDFGLSRRKLMTAVQRLEDAGAVTTLASDEVASVKDADPAAAAHAAAEEQERRRLMRKERLEKMRGYAEAAGCRREFLLRYLGDEFGGPCRFCDNCGVVAGGLKVSAAGGTRREVV